MDWGLIELSGLEQVCSNGGTWPYHDPQTLLVWPFVRFKTHRNTVRDFSLSCLCPSDISWDIYLWAVFVPKKSPETFYSELSLSIRHLPRHLSLSCLCPSDISQAALFLWPSMAYQENIENHGIEHRGPGLFDDRCTTDKGNSNDILTDANFYLHFWLSFPVSTLQGIILHIMQLVWWCERRSTCSPIHLFSWNFTFF